MIDCGWCDGDGAADWVYDLDGDATALEAYLPDELAAALANGSKIVRGEVCDECKGKGELYSDEHGNVAVVDSIMAYELGELPTRDVVILFAELIKTSQCWSLQGSYGRMAQSFIDADLIDSHGDVDWDLVNERIEA